MEMELAMEEEEGERCAAAPLACARSCSDDDDEEEEEMGMDLFCDDGDDGLSMADNLQPQSLPVAAAAPLPPPPQQQQRACPVLSPPPPPQASRGLPPPPPAPAPPASLPSAISNFLDEQTDTLANGASTFQRSARRSSGPNPVRAVAGLMSSVGGAVNRILSSAPTAQAEALKALPAKTLEANELYQTYPWLRAISDAFDASGLTAALAAFDAALAADASLADKPTTFIVTSEMLHAKRADSGVCADILFNVLETALPGTQTCRVVAYHLLSYGRYDDAVRLLELVRESLAPAEPHSYTDLAFARFHRLRHATSPAAALIRKEMKMVVDDLAHVLVGTEWARRFAEIEWPVLILLSWAVAWAEHALASQASTADGAVVTLWPEERLPAATYRLGGTNGPQLDVFVWLGWDTDHTDVDLHVREPTGEEVCYSHNRSGTTGARVSRDFTDGYGPEVYTLPRAPKGSFSVETNYYASHQDSSATGSTSAVVWTIKEMGRFDKEEVQFASVRLTKHKQRQMVLAVEVA